MTRTWWTGPEADAMDRMRARNRARITAELTVVVDGPDEGQATLMPLRDAIAGEFLYRWEA